MGSDMDNLGHRPLELFRRMDWSWRMVNTLAMLAMRNMEDQVTRVLFSWEEEVVVVLSLTLPFPYQKSSSPAAAP